MNVKINGLKEKLGFADVGLEKAQNEANYYKIKYQDVITSNGLLKLKLTDYEHSMKKQRVDFSGPKTFEGKLPSEGLRQQQTLVTKLER